jgi:hypothetical protein
VWGCGTHADSKLASVGFWRSRGNFDERCTKIRCGFPAASTSSEFHFCASPSQTQQTHALQVKRTASHSRRVHTTQTKKV